MNDRNKTMELSEKSKNMLEVNWESIFRKRLHKREHMSGCYAVLRGPSGDNIGHTVVNFKMICIGSKFMMTDHDPIRCTQDVEQATLFVYLTENGMVLFFQESIAGMYKNDYCSIPDSITIS